MMRFSTWKSFALFLATAALVLAITSMWVKQAAAQSAVLCGERAKVIELLAKRYQEVPRAMGLASRTGVLEIYVSKKGSWTILMTSTKGRSCMIAAGENWEELKKISLDPKT